MDYYQSAWQLYLVVSILISVLVFIMVKPLPIMFRSISQGVVFGILFVPATVTVAGSDSFAPMTAKLVVDLISGAFKLVEFMVPLVLVLVASVLFSVAIYNVFLFFQRRDASAD